MGLYFQLHKRGTANSKSIEYPIRLFYYYKGEKLSYSTDIKAKLKNFGDGSGLNPILATDKEHKVKNASLRSFKSEVQKIIDLLIVNGEAPFPIKVRNRLVGREKVEKKKANLEYRLLEVLRKYLNEEIIADKNFQRFSKNYQKSFKTSAKHIFTFISKQYGDEFEFISIDKDFIEKFVRYGMNKNLSNLSIQKLLGHLRSFMNWSREKGFHNNNNVKYFDKSIKADYDGKDMVYLYRKELLRLFEFDGFNYSNPKHTKYTTEYIEDRLKEDKVRLYTNLELCKDIFLFQCGIGSRYGDCIKIKLSDYNFKEEVFRITMEKTQRTVKIPINKITKEIFIKYSKDKTLNDYLFPLTKMGNFYPNQKINNHLKTICEAIGGFGRLVHLPIKSGKEVINNTDKPKALYSVISTHSARRTFIKEGILNKIDPYVIMALVGHKSLRVFEKYFSMNDEDKSISSKMFGYVAEGNTNSSTQSSNKSNLKDELIKLKELYDTGLLTQNVYEDRQIEIMKLHSL